MLDPLDYLKYSDNGKIIGFYHSHPVGNDFSQLDKHNSSAHNLPLVLYHIPSDNFKIFDNDISKNQYIGRPFVFNSMSCFSFIRDFYREEFSINIPNFHESGIPYLNKSIDKAKIRKSMDIISDIFDNLSKYDFEEAIEPLKYGDIICIHSSGLVFPIHFLIYIDNNEILHHKYNSYSTVEQYGSEYKSKVYKIFRHRKFVE